MPPDKPSFICLGVVHLDVAALDVAGPGVEGVRTARSSMANPSPVTNAGSFVRPGSPWSNTRTVNRPGSADEQTRVLGPVGALELAASRKIWAAASQSGAVKNMGSTTPWSLISGERPLPSMVLVPVSW